MDNGGAGYTGPVDGSSCTMYLGRRYDFRITYQSSLWYDSARFYDSVVADIDVANVYDAELPLVRPELAINTPDIHTNEETPDGSIYLATEISGNSHSSEAGVGGDEYSTVEVEIDEERTDEVGAYRIIDTGPLSGRRGAGWVVNT
jgi:hypothetical protein